MSLCFSFRCQGLTFVLAALASISCTTPSDEAYQPLGQACLSCLSEQKAEGCQTSYDACAAEASCDAYSLCQLEGRCFERKPDTGCEDELGCGTPSDRSVSDTRDSPDASVDAGRQMLRSPLQLAEAFEDCARTTCRQICGFVKP